MKKKISAGLLMYRRKDNLLEIFLVHPGGPFYTNKDTGSWSIPKGEIEEGEDPFDVAIREFKEETGINPDVSHLTPLNSIQQKGGKVVYAWAFEGDWKGEIKSNMFEMEWPPRSGLMQKFPEVDRGEFFDLETARLKINKSQVEFIDRLINTAVI